MLSRRRLYIFLGDLPILSPEFVILNEMTSCPKGKDLWFAGQRGGVGGKPLGRDIKWSVVGKGRRDSSLPAVVQNDMTGGKWERTNGRHYVILNEVTSCPKGKDLWFAGQRGGVYGWPLGCNIKWSVVGKGRRDSSLPAVAQNDMVNAEGWWELCSTSLAPVRSRALTGFLLLNPFDTLAEPQGGLGLVAPDDQH